MIDIDTISTLASLFYTGESTLIVDTFLNPITGNILYIIPVVVTILVIITAIISTILELKWYDKSEDGYPGDVLMLIYMCAAFSFFNFTGILQGLLIPVVYLTPLWLFIGVLLLLKKGLNNKTPREPKKESENFDEYKCKLREGL